MKATSFFRMASILGLITVGGRVAAADQPPAPTKEEPVSMTYLVDVGENKAAKEDAGTFVSVDDPQAAALAKYGSALIERIGMMLVNEVDRQLASNDLVDSVDVMHLKHLNLPPPKPGEPKVTAIKRTSSMLRDPANAPDAADTAALDRVFKQLMANEAPDKVIVQKIEHPGQPVEWRVYRPIATTQSCLACHGDPAKFEPAVRELLNKRYPGDKAVDYRRQEYRGMLRVSLQAPEPAKN
ncbi:MAG TPA: DUF3365 domain-containing protein [Lacunisphaera sp.]|nr:DUF3365 domain-containing protein [Lacunisphaera sp.]